MAPLLAFIGLAFAPARSEGALSDADFLKANGAVIRRDSGKGSVVVLQGTNLGGWQVQEAWMSPNGFGRVPASGWALTHSAAGLTVQFGQWLSFHRLHVAIPKAQAESIAIEAADGEQRWTTLKVSALRAEDATHTEVTLDDVHSCQALRITGPGLDPHSTQGLSLDQDDDYSTRTALSDRFGPSNADVLIRAYQRSWLKESDLDNIRSWGMNVVRVPINWLEFVDAGGHWKKAAFEQLDWLVSLCRERDLYVILDLHAVPGGASPWSSSGRAGDDGSGQNPNGFWTNPDCQALVGKIWAGIAQHYRGNATIAGYDLVNEPLYQADEQPRKGSLYSEATLVKSAMYDRLYHTVRAVDPDHLLFIEAFAITPPHWDPNSGAISPFSGMTPPSFHGWTNVVYETHHYDMDHPRDHEAQARLVRASLEDIERHQREWNVPLFAGEYSLYAFYDVWKTWMLGLNRLNVSWTSWTYKVRGTAQDPAGKDWGFFHTNTNPIPDINNDSADEIIAKWGRFSTDHFIRNTGLIDTVSHCTSRGPAPSN